MTYICGKKDNKTVIFKNNNMNAINLVPTNGRKSFYNKAKVINNGTKYILKSYDTDVCEYDYINDVYSLLIPSNSLLHSATTKIHIKSFKETYNIKTN